MAKDKKKPIGTKAKAKKAPPSKARPRAKASVKPKAKVKSRAKSAPATRTVKVVRVAKARAKEVATNPAVAEIVAASLVAAAAAIKNPKKARDMASAVGDQLETASKQAVDRGNAFWQLAIDIARRSIDALGAEKSPRKAKRATKKKSKK